MRIRNRLQSDDQGAVLITVGIFLLALMVFAAWAVDISSVLVERRSAQNTADVSALSGAQMTLRLAPDDAMAAAEAEVIRLSAANFGTPPADWAACTDSSKPGRFSENAPGGSQCVSFTEGLTELRVRVPNTDVPTNFAGVIGINTIATSAFAEVTTGNGQSGGVLPFGLPPSAGSPEVCLKTGPGPLPAPPCDGPDEGNFGFLDFKIYTDPVSCNAGDLIANIASGVDHFLETGSTNPSSVHEFDFCPNINARPDRTKAQTGNVASKFHEGFVDSSSPTARFQRGPWTKTNTMGQQLDDKPLWEFISAGNDLCAEATIAATVPNPHDGMAACLSSGDAGSLRFFEDSGGISGVYDLIESPRWAFVPNIKIDFVSGGSQDYIFTSFSPVFLQTLYGDCNAGSCGEFNPGEGSNIGANKKAVAVTAFLIPITSLPAEVIAAFPGTEISIDYLLSR